LWLSIGAALFLAGLLLGETEYGSYISGFGGGLTAVGLVRLLRVRRLSRDPEKAADYDASLKDERHGVCRQQGAQHDLLHLRLRSARRGAAGDPGVRAAACRAGALRPDLLAGAALHRILLAL